MRARLTPWGLLLVLSAHASPDSLSLEDCLSLAHYRNPRGFISADAVESVDLARQELRSQYLPKLKYKGVLEYAPASKRFSYDPALTNNGQMGSQVVLEQILYDSGQRRIKARQAELESDRARKEQVRDKIDLDYEVAQAFTEVLRLQSETAIKQIGAAQLKDYLALVERMHAGGQAGFTDVLKTRIQVSEAEAALRQTEVDRNFACWSLAELIGRESGEELAVKGSLDSASTPIPLDTNGNADLELARLGFQGAELEVEASRNEWKPTLALAADAGLLTSFENLEQSSANRSPMLGASAGLQLDWPLFNWGLRGLHLRRRRLDADKARWQWRLQTRSLLIDYRNTLSKWSAARDHRDALQANLSAARDNFILTKSKYAGGGGLASEVLEAHKLWMDIQSMLTQTQADLRDLGAKLERMAAR